MISSVGLLLVSAVHLVAFPLSLLVGHLVAPETRKCVDKLVKWSRCHKVRSLSSASFIVKSILLAQSLTVDKLERGGKWELWNRRGSFVNRVFTRRRRE